MRVSNRDVGVVYSRLDDSQTPESVSRLFVYRKTTDQTTPVPPGRRPRSWPHSNPVPGPSHPVALPARLVGPSPVSTSTPALPAEHRRDLVRGRRRGPSR